MDDQAGVRHLSNKAPNSQPRIRKSHLSRARESPPKPRRLSQEDYEDHEEIENDDEWYPLRFLMSILFLILFGLFVFFYYHIMTMEGTPVLSDLFSGHRGMMKDRSTL